MRIHLPLHPSHFKASYSGPSDSPLVNVGGDLVIIELQGELSYEGDQDGGVVGVLGFDRPDKPTLHLGQHHLLHGKIVTLQKPYAVIRKAGSGGTAIEGDAEDEEEVLVDRSPIASSSNKRARLSVSPVTRKDEDDEEEEDGPLFDKPQAPATPDALPPLSSSPIYPPSAIRDYSSELDPSSPARFTDDEDEDANMVYAMQRERREKAKRKRKTAEGDRVRHYEVVGIVRKKVVFALRPEPIVTATILPE